MDDGITMYFDNMAKLTCRMSKETKFLFHMLRLMEWDQETTMNIVHLNTCLRRKIINNITPDSKDPLSLSRQYLSRLCKQGRIKIATGGSYLIDPALFGYSKYVKPDWRKASGDVYENRIFYEDGTTGVEAYIITTDGERIELS